MCVGVAVQPVKLDGITQGTNLSIIIALNILESELAYTKERGQMMMPEVQIIHRASTVPFLKSLICIDQKETLPRL